MITDSNLDNPKEDPNIRGDAFKTLIVARLAYDATEKDLEGEFGRFGPIERVWFIPSSTSAQTNKVVVRSALSLIHINTKNPERRRRSIAAMLSWYTSERKI
jgi:RNA recognition motif-containing protein